jgi:hypothetical protein
MILFGDRSTKHKTQNLFSPFTLETYCKEKFVMTRLSLSERAVYPSCSLPQKRSDQLTARWIVVDEKLVCKWLVE